MFSVAGCKLHCESVFLQFRKLARIVTFIENDQKKREKSQCLTFTGNVAAVFSERELKFMFAICHRRSVCLSSVCNVGAPYSGD